MNKNYVIEGKYKNRKILGGSSLDIDVELGVIAGVKGKKKKEYLIAVEWKDGEKSLISLDDEYYKVFVKSNF